MTKQRLTGLCDCQPLIESTRGGNSYRLTLYNPLFLRILYTIYISELYVHFRICTLHYIYISPSKRELREGAVFEIGSTLRKYVPLPSDVISVRVTWFGRAVSNFSSAPSARRRAITADSLLSANRVLTELNIWRAINIRGNSIQPWLA